MASPMSDATQYTVWALWRGDVSVPPYVHHVHAHGTTREIARALAATMNRAYGVAGGSRTKYLAGPVGRPPPVGAFE
jgi:hypothetical protein